MLMLLPLLLLLLLLRMALWLNPVMRPITRSSHV
jgi:hypothetical protein